MAGSPNTKGGSPMLLRDHPLVSYRRISSWPPVWTWVAGLNSKHPVGEIGILRDVQPSNIEPADSGITAGLTAIVPLRRSGAWFSPILFRGFQSLNLSNAFLAQLSPVLLDPHSLTESPKQLTIWAIINSAPKRTLKRSIVLP